MKHQFDRCLNCGKPIERVLETWWYHPRPDGSNPGTEDQFCHRLTKPFMGDTDWAFPAEGCIRVTEERPA